MQPGSLSPPDRVEGNPAPVSPMVSPLAVFEHIGPVSRILAYWYLMWGCQVRYLEMDPRVTGWAPFRKFRENGSLEKIRGSDLDLGYQYSLNNRTLDGIDEVFEKELGSSRLVPLVQTLVGSDPARFAYLKYLALDRYDRALRMYQLAGTASGSGGEAVLILRSPPLAAAIPPGSRQNERIRDWLPLWNRITLSVKSFGARVGYGGALILFPLYILAKIGIPSPGKREREAYRAGIRVYGTDFGCSRRYRSVDFLVNGKELDTRNTLICMETDLDPLYRACLKERGYQTVDLGQSLRGINMDFIRRILLRKGFLFWIRCIPRGFLESADTVRRTLEFSLTYLLWEAFFEKYTLSHYVTYNDALPKSIIRNIVMSQHGVQSWYYEHSSNTANLFVPLKEGCQEYQTVHYSYLAFDHLVCWGDKIQRFYAMHPQLIGSYELLGCPWSEHVAMARGDTGRNTCLEMARRHFAGIPGGIPGRLIGIFDTSPSNDTFLTLEKLVAFLTGILQMMEEEGSCGFIFKMKYPWHEIEDNYPQLIPLYDRIRACQRCLLLDAMTTEVSEIIALSDLVISACFTSPTIEALGARKRAVYYDADGSFRDCYYDSFPDLVAHNYDELRRLIDFWLISVTPASFDEYLETWVKGELDAFVDGKGITRFREMLLR